MHIGMKVRVVFFSFLCLILFACSDAAFMYPGSSGCVTGAERWDEADRLFRNDDRWLGGDGAASIDLGAGRVLWLFGDSFIGRGYSRDRRSAVVVRNTVAVQRGYDPSRASAAFYWSIVDGSPDAFFQSPGPYWYWPGGGVLVEGRLLVFLMEIDAADNDLGFDGVGWAAVLVKDPVREPSRWSVSRVRTPQNDYGVIVGSAGGMVIDGYLYAFGAHSADHGAYLLRWKLDDAARGDLMHPQWWTGDGGWVDQGLLTHRPDPVFKNAQMEFSVHYEEAAGRFIQVQSETFPKACLVYRWSRSLTGPWSKKKMLYCPEEARETGVLFYAAKAHPWLEGPGLLCTYALNSLNEDRLLDSHDLYYPAFVSITIAGP